MFNTSIRLFFYIGVGVILYLLGQTASYYQWYPSKILANTLGALEETQKRNLVLKQRVEADEVERLFKQKHVVWNNELADNGYTLITLRYDSTAYLVDMSGNVVHDWNIPFHKIWENPTHTNNAPDKWIYLEKALVLENGDLLATYTAGADTPYGYGIVKVDKHSNPLWKYNQNAHHDISIDPDTGNIFALVQHFTAKKPYDSIAFPTLEDFVVVLSPEGNELKRVSVLDAFYNSTYRLLLNDYNKNTLDWDRTHTNSVSVLSGSMAKHFPQFKAGQLLISLRNMDTIAILDLETEEIVWAFNGIWRAQHSPQFLSNGNILLLDNKGHVENHTIYSRVMEFNPRTLGIDWSYPKSKPQRFFTDSFGRVQRLQNGNTLITDAMNGRIIEVTPEGNHAWEFKIPLFSRKLNHTVDSAIKMEGNIKYYMEEPLVFDPNISGIITNATRYKKEQLPFLQPSLSIH